MYAYTYLRGWVGTDLGIAEQGAVHAEIALVIESELPRSLEC